MAAPLVDRNTGDVIPASDHNDVKDYIEDGTYRVDTLALELGGTEVLSSARYLYNLTDLNIAQNAGNPQGVVSGNLGDVLWNTVDNYIYGCIGGTLWNIVGGGLASGAVTITSLANLIGIPQKTIQSGMVVQGIVVIEVGSDYSFATGGYDGSYRAYMDVMDNTSLSNDATDKGDLTSARGVTCGVYSTTKGFTCGGWTGSSRVNIIDRIDITSTTGNATDAGDCLRGENGFYGSMSSPNYGYILGYDGTTAWNTIERIDVTVDSDDAVDNSDMTVVRSSGMLSTGAVYGFIWGGYNPSGPIIYDVLEAFDMTTTGNDAVDKGDLIVSMTNSAGNVQNNINAFVCGGKNSSGVLLDSIAYFDNTTTTGNAADGGDLLTVLQWHTGTGNRDYGFIFGGNTSTSEASIHDVIQYIDLSTVSNDAVDNSDMTSARNRTVGIS